MIKNGKGGIFFAILLVLMTVFIFGCVGTDGGNSSNNENGANSVPPPLDEWWKEIENGGEVFENFRYKIEDEGITIIRYEGKGGVVTIPAEINKIPVTIIGIHAFREKKLTDVVIPDSIILIGNYAFKNNELTNVTIGNSVTSIGRAAFFANRLTNVVIPDSVTIMGIEVFHKNELTNVTIGKSVNSIPLYAFFDNRLTSIVFPNSVTSIDQVVLTLNPIREITIGENVLLHPLSIDNLFYELYNSNGRQAGTYINHIIPGATSYPGHFWTKQ